MPNIEDVANEAQITNFDEARQASEAGFEQPTQEEIPQETPVIEAEQADITEQAVQAAEVAAQTAQQKDGELQQVMQQLQALQQQNETLQQAMQQQSTQVQENIVEEIIEPPTLDVNSLMYDDEETAKGKVNEFANGLTQFTEKNIMSKIAPFIEQAEAAQKQNEKAEVISTLSQVPELAGFQEMLPQIESIIAGNPLLQNANTEEAYINAYAIAKGVSAMNTPQQAEITPEQLLEMLGKNPEAQKLYEQTRLDKVKDSQQVPPLSASSGAYNAALNIPSKPTTLEEARKRTQEDFSSKF